MPKKQNKSMTGMRLDERKMATAGAVVGALCSLVMGLGYAMMGGAYGGWGMMGGYGNWGFYPTGMLFGAVWALLLGAIVGYVFAWVYNRA